jgi:hypothetical protein
MARGRAGKLGAPSRLACDLFADYTEQGYQPPHLAIRSHNHRAADTYNNFPIRVIYTGSWSLATEYVYRSGMYTADMLADIGGYYVTCDNGKFTVDLRRYQAQRRQIWAGKM